MFQSSPFSLTLVAPFAAFTASHASADVVAAWDFESPDLDSISESLVGPTAAASTGSGSFFGVHANPESDWTIPAGNGSSQSYRGNGYWGVGDYFQFSTSTIGFQDITLTFDAAGRNNGPRDFKVQISTDGSTFTDTGVSYLVLDGRDTSPRFGTDEAVANETYKISLDLGHIDDIENASTAYFRLVMTSTAGADGFDIGEDSSSQIDNLVINGSPVPEPASLLLIGAAGLTMLSRRRRD